MTPEERAEQIAEKFSHIRGAKNKSKAVKEIARVIREAVEEEREACIAIVSDAYWDACNFAISRVLGDIVERIRARGGHDE